MISNKKATWIYNQATCENGNIILINDKGNIVVEYHDYDKTDTMGFMKYFYDGTGKMPCLLQKENYKILLTSCDTEILRQRALQAKNDIQNEVAEIQIKANKTIEGIKVNLAKIKEFQNS